MSIETELTQELQEGMRQKDSDRVACIRQVKAKMQERVNAKGFTGEVNDELWLEVIGSYVKMLKKSIEDGLKNGIVTRGNRAVLPLAGGARIVLVREGDAWKITELHQSNK